MTPLESLHEEYNNVDRALQETLRYDYGPEQSAEFYDECAGRLGRIKRRIESCNPTDRQSVAALLSDLGYVATLISLIERSHLGELSWPFADELRRLAKALLTEPGLLGDPSYPIVHVVADGRGYRILHEDAAKSANSGRRLAKQGMARFEVLGPEVRRKVSGEPPKKGGIFAALRRLPLVGADLDLKRSFESGRKVDL